MVSPDLIECNFAAYRFRENFIIGFIIIGGSITKFMAPEDYLALSQCQTHIAAAVTKMQKIHALSYNAERTLS